MLLVRSGATAFVVILGLLAGARLDAQVNIFEPSGPGKVKISVSENYRDSLKVFREDGGVSREVVPTESLVARIEAPLEGADTSTFDGETEVILIIGDLIFDAALGDDPKYVPGKKSATIALGDFVENEDGSERFRKVGFARISWTGIKLRVLVVCADLGFAGVSGVGASSYVEIAEPGITAMGAGDPILVDVSVGSLSGEIECNSLVTSKTTLRKIGNPESEFYDEFLLSKVALKAGTAVPVKDPITGGGGGGGGGGNGDPRLTGKAVAKPGMMVDITGTVREIENVQITAVTIFGMPLSGTIAIGEPDSEGVQTWSITGIQMPFPKGTIDVTFAGEGSAGEPVTAFFQTPVPRFF